MGLFIITIVTPFTLLIPLLLLYHNENFFLPLPFVRL